MPADGGERAAAGEVAFLRIGADGASAQIARDIAVECPIAIEFNGIGYAVMMATPADLDDFVVGFTRAERLIDGQDDIIAIDCHMRPEGTLLRVTLADGRIPGVVERVRHRVSESSCGLCGIENLEQALRPLPRLAPGPCAEPAAVFAALSRLRAHQPLHRRTGAVHAAALCSADGAIRLCREDVGRHNAFDKLTGAMLREGAGWEGGFALLTSRCSYELVEKAVLAGCPTLVTVSAPTSLALERARAAGLHLVVLAREDALLVAPS